MELDAGVQARMTCYGEGVFCFDVGEPCQKAVAVGVLDAVGVCVLDGSVGTAAAVAVADCEHCDTAVVEWWRCLRLTSRLKCVCFRKANN